jgi:O-antigen ligase
LRVPRASLPILGFGVLFIVYAVGSLIWSPSHVYGMQKAEFLGTLNLWALVAPAVVIAADRGRERRFIVFLFAFSLLIGINAGLMSADTAGRQTLNVLGGDYLGVGRAVGAGTAIALAVLLAPRIGAVVRVVALGLFLASLWLLILGGGRGPFMAAVVASLIPLILGVRLGPPGFVIVKRYMPWALALVIVVAAVTVVLGQGPNPPQTLGRLQVLSTESMGGSSAATRFSWYGTSIRLWEQRPVFGYGVGSWPVLMGFRDARNYPHDIFLEILVENGGLGLLLFVGMLVAGLASLAPWRTISSDPWRVLLLMLFVNALINSMISGDLPDNRFLFAATGMLAFVGGRRP